MPSPRSDFALLDAWRHGDRDAGEQLFEHYFDAILGYFARRAGPDAEDLTQRTFLACLEHREHIRGDASFRTFLFAVAHNVLFRHLRGKHVHDDRTDGSTSGIFDVSPSSSAVLAVCEEREEIHEALSRLEPVHRRVLELYYWERCTSAQIASKLGVPHGTARTRLRRARGLLRTELERVRPDRRHHTRRPSHTSSQSLSRARGPIFGE